MSISVTYDATQGHHGCILAQVTSKDHVWVPGPTAARVYDDIHDLCHYQGPHRYLGSGSLPMAMLGTQDYAAAGAMTIWVTCTTNSDHGTDWAQVVTKRHNWFHELTAARVEVIVSGSYYHQV